MYAEKKHLGIISGHRVPNLKLAVPTVKRSTTDGVRCFSESGHRDSNKLHLLLCSTISEIRFSLVTLLNVTCK